MSSGCAQGHLFGNLSLRVGLPESNLRKQRRRRMADQCERKCRQGAVWFPNTLRWDTTKGEEKSLIPSVRKNK